MQIEGKNAVLEALRAGTAIDKLLIERGAERSGIGGTIFRQAREKGIPVTFAPREALDRQSLTGRHQGFLALSPDFSYASAEEILALARERGEDPFVVLLDGVEDPHNLGSVIRVCECAGVHGLIIPEHRSAKVNETVMRVSAGACNHVRIARTVNLAAELDALKEAGLWTAGLEADGEPIWGTDLGGPLALVVGGEGKGIRPLVRRHCDRVVSIPMRGKVNSLNASVACGVAVFEVLRRRTGGN